MTYTTIKSILLYVIIIALIPSCTSVEKLVDNGNYDEAIEIARRKLSGKNKPNPKYVFAVRDALEAANERDLRTADRFKSQGSSTDWERVFRIYSDIDRRQEKVRPLLPLVDKHGINADVKFVRVSPMLAEARNQAAAQTYTEGNRLLAQGRAGNKEAARAAYRSFDATKQYLSNYRDVHQLQNEAEQLGVVYVKVEMENATRAYLPAGFERDLLAVNLNGMDSQWRRFHLRPESGLNYDYTAKIVIADVAVSPERITERAYLDQKQIVDGEEYVLDANGNVMKDTLGNDITRPRKVTISAEVYEVFQSKSAIVTGELILLDVRNNRPVDRKSITTESVFENYASTFNGDRRALSSVTRRRIGNRPTDFPPSEVLILQAAGQLKPILQQKLAASARLI